MAGAREHGLGDGGHGRRTDARNVDQSARRCGTGCTQPAHCDPRASVGSAFARASPRLVPLVTSRLPRRRLPARPGRPLAVADSRRDVRHLPISQAGHMAVPPLARRVPRTCSAGRVACDDGDGAVGGMGDRRCCCAVGGRLRPLLLALRPRPRSRGRAPLVGRSLRRARRLHRRTRSPRRHCRACSRWPVSDSTSRFFYWLGVSCDRGAAGLRALDRAARRSAPARCRLFHAQRRDQRRRSSSSSRSDVLVA